MSAWKHALAKVGRRDFSDYPDSIKSLDARSSLGRCSLAMCHGDFVGRNIILQENGALCIIDWAALASTPCSSTRSS